MSNPNGDALNIFHQICGFTIETRIFIQRGNFPLCFESKIKGAGDEELTVRNSFSEWDQEFWESLFDPTKNAHVRNVAETISRHVPKTLTIE